MFAVQYVNNTMCIMYLCECGVVCQIVYASWRLPEYCIYISTEGDADVTLIQDPSDNELDLGSSVTFTCKVEGFPLPTKLKFKSLENIYNEYDIDISSDSDITTGTYYISYANVINGLKLSEYFRLYM